MVNSLCGAVHHVPVNVKENVFFYCCYHIICRMRFDVFSSILHLNIRDMREEGQCRQALRNMPKVRNEIRNLTELAGSITTLTIYWISSVLPPQNLFLSQYGIHFKPFLHLINRWCNISLLVFFQVMIGPCNLACVLCKCRQKWAIIQTC